MDKTKWAAAIGWSALSVYEQAGTIIVTVMEALFIADRKPPLNSQEGRDRELNVF